MPIREQPTVPEHNATDAKIQKAIVEKAAKAAVTKKS